MCQRTRLSTNAIYRTCFGSSELKIWHSMPNLFNILYLFFVPKLIFCAIFQKIKKNLPNLY
ncbi:hypothetical protein BpHYR1_030919 [Brachionus plicatilis]|uniref:Uncharacterized protein n=1 Tax=Brachionus plicatilis TaxID=10195 RepID=A0A3M7SBF4_BRAPC|nr:hypothetical protein BpHYR1_030919 [Brachionus plicatilis]